ncbi:immunity protein Imm1 of predicted polymorphic toxin system [Nonomuraea polychroma]|uniref:Immunity protein Imm1 of predicted polymorphic toxin system n=1 Tax=Nonomuraea polychroma TaxID=46176 RepID=A0A438M539_9ACTN|nr:Imm1 family immunity protein [Nonomuraea polychroma]RVX40558.1 immunity protein Imm1 of predicted polymorphic toxin system [Nonomuraea polychroma]
MILSVLFNNEVHYSESWDATSRLITEAMESLRGEEQEADGAFYPGDDAWFRLAERGDSDEAPVAKSYLRVAINRHTGYGAAVWFVNQEFPKGGEIYESVWISDNSEPPDFDPRVVSDPHYPLFHDPTSTLPIPRIRTVVEEFCRVGTGERPECISWVAGEMNGQRFDRPPITEFVEDPEIDWDSLR